MPERRITIWSAKWAPELTVRANAVEQFDRRPALEPLEALGLGEVEG